MLSVPKSDYDPITYLVARKHAGLTGTEVQKREERRKKQKEDAELAKRASAINVRASYPASAFYQNLQTDPKIRALEELVIMREIEASAYRAELDGYPAEQLSALVQTEREKEKAELIAKVQAEENGRHFNLPTARADFNHYCKAALWTLDESIALALGKEPRAVNWKSVSPYVQVSAFAKRYERLRDLCIRAKNAGQLFDPVFPTVFLGWPRDKNIEVVPELTSTAVNDGISLQGWKDLHENLKSRYKSDTDDLVEKYKVDTSKLLHDYKRNLNDLTVQLTDARTEVARLRSELNAKTAEPFCMTEARPLMARERDSLLSIALLCAIRGFNFDPDKRNDASAMISSGLESLGLSLSDDAVRNHLKSAAEMLPGNWREKLRRSPNSVKR